MSDKFKYTAGLNNVGSYQVSGKPFVTASTISDGAEQQIEFPEVTNNVTVKLDSAAGSSAIKMEGQEFYYENSDTSNVAANGESRSLSIWVSASAGTVGTFQTILISGTNDSLFDNFSIRTVGTPLMWHARARDYGANPAISASIDSGWQHLVLTTEPLDANGTKFYKNGIEVGTSTTAQTQGIRLGGGMRLGPWYSAGSDCLFEIKNAVLWDDALTNTQVANLYKAGSDTSHTGYTTGSLPNKLVWVKPEENAGSDTTTLKNAGDFATYGDLTLIDKDVGDSATLVNLSAFSGIMNNSLRISGSAFLTSSGDIYTGDGDGDYSVSMWFKSRNSVANERALFTIGNSSARASVREKANRLDFCLAHYGDTSTNIASIKSYYPTQADQWNFLTFVSKNGGGGSQATASMNGVIEETIFQSGKTSIKAYLNTSVKKLQIAGVINAVHNSNPDTIGDEMFIRDFILWDGSLSEADITTLYNDGDYYDFNSFTTYDKLAWIKPDELTNTAFDNSSQITNSGITGSFMEVVDYNVGEIVEVNTDAPFTSPTSSGGSGGELRVHYRSTGSSNVATNKHYWTLDGQNESITMNVKSKEIYLSADGGDIDYSLQADLTNIPSSRMFQHTGSGVDE